MKAAIAIIECQRLEAMEFPGLILSIMSFYGFFSIIGVFQEITL